MIRKQLAQVRQFTPQAGLRLGRTPRSPEFFLQELTRSFAIPSCGQEGDQSHCLAACNLHPRSVRAFETKRPHQPDRVNSGSPGHSNDS